MLYREDEILLIICALIQILRLYHLLEAMLLVNIFTLSPVLMERESSAIWELKITELLCQMPTKRMRLTL